MARLGETFDATAVEPNKPLEPLPPGRDVVQIVNSEMRPTKDGMGQYLWLELDVLEGEYAGRKLFDRLNLVNSSRRRLHRRRGTSPGMPLPPRRPPRRAAPPLGVAAADRGR